MLLYIEACESGSMFNGLLKADIGVLAVTAAAPNEASMACYYNNTLGTFLGDCFSNHWLEHEVCVWCVPHVLVHVCWVARVLGGMCVACHVCWIAHVLVHVCCMS
jgi:hypothetical protein